MPHHDDAASLSFDEWLRAGIGRAFTCACKRLLRNELEGFLRRIVRKRLPFPDPFSALAENFAEPSGNCHKPFLTFHASMQSGIDKKGE
jgi:hypothetical protein